MCSEYDQWQDAKAVTARLLYLLETLPIEAASELLGRVAKMSDFEAIVRIVDDAEAQNG